ncbi:MAG: rhomboid family intramembrane serine protease [Parvularculaceae bacterium]
MIPIGDENGGRRRLPFVTVALIAANAVAFYLEILGGEPFVLNWAFVPQRFSADPSADSATLFTAMFLHAGWMHLGGNMLYLWIFGDNVENRFGHFQFIMFYLASGLAATFSQYAVDVSSAIPNVGASGAIAGVLGAYLLMFPRAQVSVLVGPRVVAVPAYFILGTWIVMQLVAGYGAIADTMQTEEAEQGGIAYAAHVGGFAAGLVIAIGLGGLRRPQA